MKKQIYTLLLFMLIGSVVYATHERAGEITYRHIAGLTYEITLITYTYSPSPADRPELEIKWGDETSTVLPRDHYVDLSPVIRRNTYIGQHTYSGNGVFKISLEDPNRNYGIINIPNSVNIPFYIETELVINPFLGSNSSVVLLNPPLDYGCVNRLYIHNPGAYDPDGDSLSYKLTVCKGAGGLPIPGYQLPQASNSFTINEYTGDLIWDSPVLQGEYNVAFIIEEWRYGQRIGYVTRDLQIQIDACNNNPPVIITIDDTCVEAGDTLTFEISAEDPDGDQVTLSATGSPFLQNDSPAVMNPNPVTGEESVSAVFTWPTECSHVRKNPHTAYFKAIDDSEPVHLSSYKTVSIQVVAPSPENLEAIPLGTSIILDWEQSICPGARGYYIYRRESYLGFEPGPCETGVPGYTGYEKIAELMDIEVISYTDDNEGAGLIHGIEYCYMVTAFFPDGAESYASNEACATLRKDLPIITNVSVNNTSQDNGSIYVAWSKPTELDLEQTPGPFQYKLYSKSNAPGADFELVTTYDDLDDTIVNHLQINTLDYQYRYRIDFYNDTEGNYFMIGSTFVTPSIYISVEGTDQTMNLSWNNDVPWINDTFVVYRQNPVTLDFDSINWTNFPEYSDTGLINGNEYCYYIKTIGRYSASGFVDPIINDSQENCGKPIDNIPPCPPVLSVSTNCEILINNLSWTYPDSCDVEDLTYYIYFAGSNASDYILYDSTINNFYIFETIPPSVVGCFAITALDSLWNQSQFSNVECVDINECGRIGLPIVFTPNSDGYNDYFYADSVNSIHKLNLKIFNRWGGIVYESNDPFFEWDGKDHNNNTDCSPGVYFFEAIVSEYTLRGPVERRITGSVTLLR